VTRPRPRSSLGALPLWLALATPPALSLCAGPRPCAPATLTAIEADYSEAVLGQCRGYSSLAECPAVPALQSKREARELDAGCR
jgi:hypothetical protein